jgi:hypothetical protein
VQKGLEGLDDDFNKLIAHMLKWKQDERPYMEEVMKAKFIV